MLGRPAGLAGRRGIVKEDCEDGFMLTKSYFGPVKMNFLLYIMLNRVALSSRMSFFLTDLYAHCIAVTSIYEILNK